MTAKFKGRVKICSIVYNPTLANDSRIISLVVLLLPWLQGNSLVVKTWKSESHFQDIHGPTEYAVQHLLSSTLTKYRQRLNQPPKPQLLPLGYLYQFNTFL